MVSLCLPFEIAQVHIPHDHQIFVEMVETHPVTDELGEPVMLSRKSIKPGDASHVLTVEKGDNGGGLPL